MGALVTHTWVRERATMAGKGHFQGSLQVIWEPDTWAPQQGQVPQHAVYPTSCPGTEEPAGRTHTVQLWTAVQMHSVVS